MADSDTQILIGIKLDDKQASDAVVDANHLAEKIAQSLSGTISKGVDKSFTGIAVQLQFIQKVASAAFNAVGDVMGKAIDEASRADAAFSALQKSLANVGADPSGANAIAELAENLQRLGTVSDDAVIEASQSLVTIGGLAGPALERAAKASVDLAAGLGVDLGTAFDLVAKASAGNTAALGRYGLKVDETIPKAERFEAVLGLMEQRFAGFDAAKANTFAGSLTKLGTAFDDIFESVGRFITQDKVVVAVIKFISEQFGRLKDAIDSTFKNQGGIIGSLIKDLIKMSLTITELLGPAFDAAKNIAVAAWAAIKTGLQTVLTGIAGLGLAVSKVLNTVGIVSDESLAQTQSFFNQQSAALVESATATSAAIKQEFSGGLPITDALKEFLTEMQVASTLAPELAQTTAEGVAAPIAKVAADISNAAKSINQAIGQGIVRSISGGISALVNALVKGANGFQAFANAVLGIVGDMAIQIGTTLLGVGLGIEALRASLATLSGGQAIAAGLALIAFGALLKSLSGGGATSSAGVGTAGAGGGAGEVPGGASTAQAPLERDTKTAVAINIQGNVLDRRETGLEIATVLQEYFDTNDGVVARG